jgi:hypothetical protein
VGLYGTIGCEVCFHGRENERETQVSHSLRRVFSEKEKKLRGSVNGSWQYGFGSGYLGQDWTRVHTENI